MNEKQATNPEEITAQYHQIFLDFPLWRPLRIVLRFTALFCWILACYGVARLCQVFLLPFQKLRKNVLKSLQERWCRGMCYFLGIRLTAYGTIPKDPFFVVINHITWVDYFAYAVVIPSMRPVFEAEGETFPFAGTLLSAGRAIFHLRHRKAIPDTLKKMRDALEAGDSIVLAPEGVVGPGKEVRHFHAALLEAAIQTKTPVHASAITCQSPKGCPPAKEVLLYGPDHLFIDRDGNVPQAEIDAWGRPVNSFLLHLLRLLALPYGNFEIRFADEPIWRDERIELANALHDQVQDLFVPVD
jgi:lyso-ornithine lipid O-acyltransferase